MTNLRQVTWLTTIINAFEYSNSRYQLNPSTSIVNPQTDKFPEIILNYSFTQLIKTPTQKLPITTNSIATEKWKKNTYSGETGIELLPHGIELGINQAQRNENPRKEVELEEGGGELEAENRKWRSGRQNQRKRACVRGDLSDPKVALAVSETNEVLLLLIQRSIRPYEFDEENIKRKKKTKKLLRRWR